MNTATTARNVTPGHVIRHGGTTARVAHVHTTRAATTITVDDGGRITLGPNTTVLIVA